MMLGKLLAIKKWAIYSLFILSALFSVSFSGLGATFVSVDKNDFCLSNAHLFCQDAYSSILGKMTPSEGSFEHEDLEPIFIRHNEKKFSSQSALFPLSKGWELSLDENATSVDLIGCQFLVAYSRLSIALKLLVFNNTFVSKEKYNKIMISKTSADLLMNERGISNYESLIGERVIGKNGSDQKEFFVDGVFAESCSTVFLNDFFLENFSSPCFFYTGEDCALDYDELFVTSTKNQDLNRLLRDDLEVYCNQLNCQLSFPICNANNKENSSIRFLELQSVLSKRSSTISIIFLSLSLLSFLLCELFLLGSSFVKRMNNLSAGLLILAPIIPLIFSVVFFGSGFSFFGLYFFNFSKLGIWLVFAIFTIIEISTLFKLKGRFHIFQSEKEMNQQVEIGRISI